MASDPDRFASFTASSTSVPPTPPAREPVFNAPIVAILLALSIPGLYALQMQLPDTGLRWAFRPVSLFEGGWWPPGC